MPTNFWDPNLYSQFLNSRTRPARDLLAAIPNECQPNKVYDLGCGPGNSTNLLHERWPQASIIGLDSSTAMIDKAKAEYPNLEFIEDDITQFNPDTKPDLIFANASLQWLPNHQQLIPNLVKQLSEHGTLAIQMPNNFHAATHQLGISILQQSPNWQLLLDNLIYGELHTPKYNLNSYYDILSSLDLTNLQLWETTYCQTMPDHQAIFDWIRGTGLRPALSEMSEANQNEFAKLYIKQISDIFPTQSDGKVLFSFRRIFMLATKR